MVATADGVKVSDPLEGRRCGLLSELDDGTPSAEPKEGTSQQQERALLQEERLSLHLPNRLEHSQSNGT